MALSKIHLGRALGSNTIGSAKITDGTLVNADFATCAAVAQTKTATGSTTEVNNATFKVKLSKKEALAVHAFYFQPVQKFYFLRIQLLPQ